MLDQSPMTIDKLSAILRAKDAKEKVEHERDAARQRRQSKVRS